MIGVSSHFDIVDFASYYQLCLRNFDCELKYLTSGTCSALIDCLEFVLAMDGLVQIPVMYLSLSICLNLKFKYSPSYT